MSEINEQTVYDLLDELEKMNNLEEQVMEKHPIAKGSNEHNQLIGKQELLDTIKRRLMENEPEETLHGIIYRTKQKFIRTSITPPKLFIGSRDELDDVYNKIGEPLFYSVKNEVLKEIDGTRRKILEEYRDFTITTL